MAAGSGTADTPILSRPYQPYDGGLSRPPNWMVDREEVAVSVNVYSVQPNAEAFCIARSGVPFQLAVKLLSLSVLSVREPESDRVRLARNGCCDSATVSSLAPHASKPATKLPEWGLMPGSEG